jgi:hypothetical protein
MEAVAMELLPTVLPVASVSGEALAAAAGLMSGTHVLCPPRIGAGALAAALGAATEATAGDMRATEALMPATSMAANLLSAAVWRCYPRRTAALREALPPMLAHAAASGSVVCARLDVWHEEVAGRLAKPLPPGVAESAGFAWRAANEQCQRLAAAAPGPTGPRDDALAIFHLAVYGHLALAHRPAAAAGREDAPDAGPLGEMAERLAAAFGVASLAQARALTDARRRDDKERARAAASDSEGEGGGAPGSAAAAARRAREAEVTAAEAGAALLSLHVPSFAGGASEGALQHLPRAGDRLTLLPSLSRLACGGRFTSTAGARQVLELAAAAVAPIAARTLRPRPEQLRPAMRCLAALMGVGNESLRLEAYRGLMALLDALPPGTAFDAVQFAPRLVPPAVLALVVQRIQREVARAWPADEAAELALETAATGSDADERARLFAGPPLVDLISSVAASCTASVAVAQHADTLCALLNAALFVGLRVGPGDGARGISHDALATQVLAPIAPALSEALEALEAEDAAAAAKRGGGGGDGGPPSEALLALRRAADVLRRLGDVILPGAAAP